MLELYHFWDSVCSFKVRFCLAEKGLSWQSRPIDLMRFENLTESYLAINPKGAVPALLDDGAVITESTTINEYLDDRYPETPLRPEDPLARARMRNWVKLEEDELFTAIRPVSLNLMMKQVFSRYSDDELDTFLAHHPRPDRVAFLKKSFKAPVDPNAVAQGLDRLRPALRRMERSLRANGPWLAGNTFSLADIAAAPIIDRMETLGISEAWQDLEGVSAWIGRLSARPAYAEALPREGFRLPAPV